MHETKEVDFQSFNLDLQCKNRNGQTILIQSWSDYEFDCLKMDLIVNIYT